MTVAVKKQITNVVVEYIGGVEVVIAFSQSAGSYKKYADTVRGNEDYYIKWMANSQKNMRSYNAVISSELLSVLTGSMALWLCLEKHRGNRRYLKGLRTSPCQ